MQMHFALGSPGPLASVGKWRPRSAEAQGVRAGQRRAVCALPRWALGVRGLVGLIGVLAVLVWPASAGRASAQAGRPISAPADTATPMAPAEPVSAQAIDLSPTGRLRVAITTNNTSQNTRDPATGEWRGVWIDLAHALAQRLGVPLTLAAYATDAERDAGMQRGEWDIATTADTPDQAATTGRLLAVPYLDVDNTLLVGPSASIRSIAEMDRPGVRIAAVGGTPPERAVSRVVQQATVVRATAAGELVPLLQSGQVDALAGNRPNLLGYGAQVPGSRLLADRFAVQQQRITLAPGRSAASVALASEVTRQALASGLIRTAIERYGVPGVQPTPLAAALPRTGRAVGSRPVPMVLLGIAAVVTLLGGLAQWHGSAGTLIWRRQRRRAVRWAPRFALRRRAGANLCAPSAVRPCRAAVPDAPPGRLPNPPATHVG